MDHMTATEAAERLLQRLSGPARDADYLLRSLLVVQQAKERLSQAEKATKQADKEYDGLKNSKSIFDVLGASEEAMIAAYRKLEACWKEEADARVEVDRWVKHLSVFYWDRMWESVLSVVSDLADARTACQTLRRLDQK